MNANFRVPPPIAVVRSAGSLIAGTKSAVEAAFRAGVAGQGMVQDESCTTFLERFVSRMMGTP